VKSFINFCIPLLTFSLYGAQFPEGMLLSKLQVTVQNDADWISQLNAAGALSQPKNLSKISTSCTIPLFSQYPKLKDALPYMSLGSLPTEVQKLEKLSSFLGISHFYIKRDDFTGAYENDSHYYGGNKVRKLEFLLAEALVHGANTVMTFGCAGSNHAVATALYAKRLGLKCICLLKPQANSYGVRNNLLMHAFASSELHYYPDNNFRKLGAISLWWDHKQNSGNAPYVIPTGGSSALGTIGFVNAAFELKEQIKRGELLEPDKIFVPCGSMATSVGLMLGCKLAGLKSKVVAVTIEPEEKADEFKNGIIKLFGETNSLLHRLDSSIPLVDLSAEDMPINYDFCGSNYAVFTEEGKEARKVLKEHEDILLDGTYTAKAFAGTLDYIKKNKQKNEVVLFWDTYCGLDFSKQLSKLSYSTLGRCFHSYFENDVQPLDTKY
jgi:1-aminocyclopropane-1-carboxylate deaminase/D-cysteine desulfhydrase-like pyridoxal-dependent ACC family enzyme